MREPAGKTKKEMTSFDRSLLVLGGARSGKSRHAQTVAEAIGGRLTYIATAQAYDAEMVDRISRHQADRDGRWTTIEAPIELARAITAADSADGVVLVDCLTLWTSNLLLADRDSDAATTALLSAIDGIAGRLILVANETGLGIVPDNALARRFRDLAGRINQDVAETVCAIDFVLAGIPRRWK
jgi:adenosylcobinamide kinase/adenosylcobinamide-phosphate guanylyltransferase